MIVWRASEVPPFRILRKKKASSSAAPSEVSVETNEMFDFDSTTEAAGIGPLNEGDTE